MIGIERKALKTSVVVVQRADRVNDMASIRNGNRHDRGKSFQVLHSLAFGFPLFHPQSLCSQNSKAFLFRCRFRSTRSLHLYLNND